VARVALVGIRKTFENVPVIHGLDCDIADREFIAVLGPSGCGKSTLLRIIAGLERPTAGDVVIDGRRVNDVEPKDRNIAMVFQSYALYPHMSAYDNMAYGLRLRGLDRADIAGRVTRAAATLALGGLLPRTPRHLSGGQRQRVAMGRAIVREPQVFLFDEPLSNLDATLRVQMRVELKKLHLSQGATSIFVTHDQVEAMTLGDRLLVMHAGRVEQVGPPLEVYQRPATAFVAGFIGSPAMNLLEGRVDGGTVTLAAGIRIALPPELAVEPGRAVVLGIRPEHLALEAGAGRGTVSVAVELVEALGADTVVHGRLGEGAPALTARVPGHARVTPGERVALAITGPVHLFDSVTGARLGGGVPLPENGRGVTRR
jgi:sn-glycerol 3-phosphate transport system ATP-binding protein